MINYSVLGPLGLYKPTCDGVLERAAVSMCEHVTQEQDLDPTCEDALRQRTIESPYVSVLNSKIWSQHGRKCVFRSCPQGLGGNGHKPVNKMAQV